MEDFVGTVINHTFDSLFQMVRLGWGVGATEIISEHSYKKYHTSPITVNVIQTAMGPVRW